MDDYLFYTNVDRCKQVEEATSYLEIFKYSVSNVWMCSNYRLTHESAPN